MACLKRIDEDTVPKPEVDDSDFFLLLRVTGKFAEWLRKVFTTVMNLIPKETKPLFLLPSLRPNDFKVEIARQGDGRPENHHLGL